MLPRVIGGLVGVCLYLLPLMVGPAYTNASNKVSRLGILGALFLDKGHHGN